MKIDRFTKLLLAIIAVNLSVITLKDIRFGTPSFANPIEYNIPEIQEREYGVVPLNADGSITVRLAEYDRLDVNLVDISTSDLLNVNIKDINTSDEINVNIEEVGGWNVYDKIPVVIKN